MQKQELKNTFIDTLERERTIRGWTQWEMAEKLEMSVPGYRKMVSGMTDSIALYTAYRASVVLNYRFLYYTAVLIIRISC